MQIKAPLAKADTAWTLVQSPGHVDASATVGVSRIAVGYNLAFGHTINWVSGWSPDLPFQKGIPKTELLPNTSIPVFSGALAERIKFGPYYLFCILWVACITVCWPTWSRRWTGSGPPRGPVRPAS